MAKFTVSGRSVFDVQVEADTAAQAEERWREALGLLSRNALVYLPEVVGIEMAFFSDEQPGGEPVALDVDKIDEEEPCPKCEGKGAFPATGEDCAACYGGGTVPRIAADDSVLDGYSWSPAQIAAARAHGWELSQYDDGQVVIGADEDAGLFRGEEQNVNADIHVRFFGAAAAHPTESVERRATDPERQAYYELCAAAVEIADKSLADRIREVGHYFEGYDFAFKEIGVGRLRAADDDYYLHEPETCPSGHDNRGDDVCADCGLYLGTRKIDD